MIEIIFNMLGRIAAHERKPRLGSTSCRAPLHVEVLDERVMLSATPLRLAVMGAVSGALSAAGVDQSAAAELRLRRRSQLGATASKPGRPQNRD